MQTFPCNILYHPSTNHMEYFLHDWVENIPENILDHRQRFGIEMFGICSLLARCCCSFGPKVKSSNISHKSVSCVVFCLVARSVLEWKWDTTMRNYLNQTGWCKCRSLNRVVKASCSSMWTFLTTLIFQFTVTVWNHTGNGGIHELYRPVYLYAIY